MKRVLVITYYFPPSGGSGVQRSLKFVKYLPAFGWQPVVLTLDPEYAAYPDFDPGMEKDIPGGIAIERTRSFDPYRAYARFIGKKTQQEAVSVGFLNDGTPAFRERIARWIRANVFIPDARVGWVPYATRRALALMQQLEIDACLSTGPPHSSHLIGRALRRKKGIPWIADFRDPWTDIDYIEDLPMGRIASRLNLEMEQSVLDEASLILTVSPPVRARYAARTSTRCVNIFNGYDPDDFPDAVQDDNDQFIIAHIGNMNAARNPGALWKVLSERRGGRWPAIKVRLIGNVDATIKAEIEQRGLSDQVEYIPYVPHARAVDYMLESALLLLPINRVNEAEKIIPGKIFEYMATGRPVLGIGPPDGASARLLEEADAGIMVQYEEVGRVESYLEQRYVCWDQGERFLENKEKRGRYSRKKQTETLASLLNELC